MNYIVSVPVNENVASFIGKKGSEEGIVFFNRKMDSDVIVAIMPYTREERLYQSLAETMLISGQTVISTETVDKFLGEVIIAASLLEKRALVLNENDVTKIVTGMLKDYEVCGRDDLLAKIVAHKEQHDGDLRIDIDKAFPVKGIGTVVLGVVTRGKVKVHDLLHHSSGKQVTIKSIQSQDVDVQEAGYGTRVGLAVKGIEYEEIDKGDIFITKSFQKAKGAVVTLKTSSFANEKIEVGKRYMMVSNFSHVIAKIDEINGQDAKISFEKPISVLQGDNFAFIRDQSPRIFASGKMTELV